MTEHKTEREKRRPLLPFVYPWTAMLCRCRVEEKENVSNHRACLSRSLCCRMLNRQGINSCSLPTISTATSARLVSLVCNDHGIDRTYCLSLGQSTYKHDHPCSCSTIATRRQSHSFAYKTRRKLCT
jgi:hypothetical protein